MTRKTVASNAGNDERLDRIEAALTAYFVAHDMAFRAQNDGAGLMDVYGSRDCDEAALAVLDSLTASRVALVDMIRALAPAQPVAEDGEAA